MHINFRRAIAFTLILAFLVLTPLLLMYTTGYRYNFKKAQVQRTGALVIETEPKAATIHLNGKEISDKTPARLNNFLPDEYVIDVNKDGYYSWSKKLTVKPQETTFAEDIILFAKSTPEKISDHEIKEIFFSRNQDFALFTTQNFKQDYLYLLNLNNQREKLLYNNNKLFDITDVIWSEDDSKVFFQLDGKPNVTTTIFPQQQINLESDIKNMPPKATNFQWDTNNSNLLYSQINNKIHSTNLLTLKSELLFTLPSAETLIDYLVFQDNIYLIQILNNKPVLTKATLKNENNNNNKSIELKHENYHFDKTYNNKIAFIEEPNNVFYLINQDLDRILFTKQNIKNIDLHTQNNLLLLQTDQELSYVDINRTELSDENITRYSTGLTLATWHHASDNYIFIQRDNQLLILERDSRDKHHIIDLGIENVDTFRINSDDDEIILLKDNSLWKLPLTK